MEKEEKDLTIEKRIQRIMNNQSDETLENSYKIDKSVITKYMLETIQKLDDFKMQLEEYMKWLTDTLSEEIYICTEDVKESDNTTFNENLENMHLLYSIVEDFAKENYVTVKTDDYDDIAQYYLIKFNNSIIKFERMIGQGTIYSARKVAKIDVQNEFLIDMQNIINDEPLKEFVEMETKINQLKSYAKDLGIEEKMIEKVIIFPNINE